MNKAAIYQAYYTKSNPILEYMIGMLHLSPNDNILEPCGGDGAFVDKILEKLPKAQISIFELNPSAVIELRKKYYCQNNIFIKETDTLLDESILSCSPKYDKIIGNPPYGAKNDTHKKRVLKEHYPNIYTKESYTLFLYACIRCLKENGELCFIIPDTFLSLHRHLSIRKYLLTNTRIKEITLFPSSFFPNVHFGYANLCIITLEKSSDISKNMENEISIRTNMQTVDDLNCYESGKRKKITQKAIFESISSAFVFTNAKDKIAELINDDSIDKIGDIASCVTGFYSGDDKRYLHPINYEVKNAKRYSCVSKEHIRTSALTEKEKKNGIVTKEYLVPIVKGGNIEYIKPNLWFMDWSSRAVAEYKVSKKCRFQNSDFYFRNGIGIPMIRSKKLTGALIEGRLIDQSIVGVYPKDDSFTYYLLGFFNSMICSDLINAINPSTNNSANYIKKIPFIYPTNSIKLKVDSLVRKIIIKLKGGEDISCYKNELNEIFSDLYLNNVGNDEVENSKCKTVVKQLNFFTNNL